MGRATVRAFARSGACIGLIAIIKGMKLVQVWPGEKIDDKLNDQLREAFILGAFRSVTQDIEFAINQLVEVALRALSPGINDPFTAINCIDWLGAGLSHLGERSILSPYRYDDSKKLRIIARPVTKADWLNRLLVRLERQLVPIPGLLLTY